MGHLGFFLLGFGNGLQLLVCHQAVTLHFFQTSCVCDGDLQVKESCFRISAISGHSWSAIYDGHLLADDAVEQGRFAHVGSVREREFIVSTVVSTPIQLFFCFSPPPSLLGETFL